MLQLLMKTLDGRLRKRFQTFHDENINNNVRVKPET